MTEKLETEKILQKRSNRYSFINMRPGGNDTALVLGNWDDPSRRKLGNDILMNLYPTVEQVGFVSVDTGGTVCLTMAGGEFCGNATRSTAFLALNGQPGELKMRVSGVSDMLRAGVAQDGEAFAQMPIYKDRNQLVQDPENPNAWFVSMEGITHYVVFQDSAVGSSNPEEIKSAGMKLLKEKGLTEQPASGVIFASERKASWQIDPVVYVRDIDTLFYETACGSGTTALGLVLADKTGESLNDVPIVQPSGMPIKVSVEIDSNGFSYAQIKGPIQELSRGTLIENKEQDSYVIEQLNSVTSLEKALKTLGLSDLYAQVFGEPPYSESYVEEEIEELFLDYLQKGIVLVARNDKGIVGFTAAVPLATDADITELARSFDTYDDDCVLVAELGVDKTQRRKKIGQTLIEQLLLDLPEGAPTLLRTAKDNEPAKILYGKLGFEIVPGMTQKVNWKRTDGQDLIDERIFMIKRI